MSAEIINVSHNDLDGVMCNLVLQERFSGKDIDTYHISYDSIQETLQIIDEDVLQNQTSILFITDLSFEKDNFNKLLSIAETKPWLKIFYVDHHPYEDERLELLKELRELPNVVVIHDLNRSATKLCYDYFNKSKDENLEKLVQWTNAFDIWLQFEEPENFKKGFFLNTVFWELRTKSGFKSMLKDAGYKIPKYFKELFKTYLTEKKEYFKFLKEKGLIIFDEEINCIIAFSDFYKTDFQIDYPHVDFFIIPYQTKGNNISMRINSRVKNAKDIKDKIVQYVSKHPLVISAGGHDHAFGITMENTEDKEQQFALIEGITQIIKGETNGRSGN